MKYKTKIKDRPFNAIKLGTKKIEGRVRTSLETLPLYLLKKGDILELENSTTRELLFVCVIGIRHYSDVQTMLETEGVQNVLSSGNSIDDGIKNYESYDEYKKNVPKYGIYAIEIEPI